MSWRRVAAIIAVFSATVAAVIIALDRELDDSTKARNFARQYKDEAWAAVAAGRWEEATGATSRLEHQVLQLNWFDWVWGQIQLLRLRYAIPFRPYPNRVEFERRIHPDPELPKEGPRAWWLISGPR